MFLLLDSAVIPLVNFLVTLMFNRGQLLCTERVGRLASIWPNFLKYLFPFYHILQVKRLSTVLFLTYLLTHYSKILHKYARWGLNPDFLEEWKIYGRVRAATIWQCEQLALNHYLGGINDSVRAVTSMYCPSKFSLKVFKYPNLFMLVLMKSKFLKLPYSLNSLHFLDHAL